MEIIQLFGYTMIPICIIISILLMYMERLDILNI